MPQRKWRVTRQTTMQPNALIHWDRAFQTILRLSTPMPTLPPPRKEEPNHACRPVCPCFNPTPSPSPDN